MKNAKLQCPKCGSHEVLTEKELDGKNICECCGFRLPSYLKMFEKNK